MPRCEWDHQPSARRLRHAHDAAYVLEAGQNVYKLSDQKTPESFAAQKVRVLGTLDDKTKTIRVSSITAVE